MVSTQTTDAMSFFKFVLVILDLIRFDLMIRFSTGGGNYAVFYKKFFVLLICELRLRSIDLII